MHPFEKAGLGMAPFRCLGAEHRVGPIRTTLPDGIVMEVGSPGQPMGTCAYCGTGIANCYIIRSADGKTFIVGSDCVAKTYKEAGAAVPADVKKAQSALAQEQKAKKRAAVQEAFNIRLVAARAWMSANPSAFTTERHPSDYYAGQGKTLRDYYEFVLEKGGTHGRTVIFDRINKAGGSV
jgi:hypothetical protein